MRDKHFVRKLLKAEENKDRRRKRCRNFGRQNNVGNIDVKNYLPIDEVCDVSRNRKKRKEKEKDIIIFINVCKQKRT